MSAPGESPALSWRHTPRARLRHALHYRRTRMERFWKQYFVKTRFGARWVQNLAIDLRYGGYCGGTIASPYDEKGAYGTSSTDYAELPKIFCDENGAAITPQDVLVDIGCGKARVINWWLSLGLGNKIVGIELNERIAEQAARRLRSHHNVTIVAGDATEHLPPDATMIFLFHPFGKHVFEKFKERVVEVYGQGSSLRIIYFLSLFDDVFIGDPRFTVEALEQKTFYRGAVIRLEASMVRKGQETNDDVR